MSQALETTGDGVPSPVRPAHSGTFLGHGPAPVPEPGQPSDKANRGFVRLSPGQLVPGTNYRIKRWLGEGSMGVVFEAENVEIGRRVALKVLADRLGENEAAIDAFRAEARASAQIGNPNIVDVYDFVTLEDGRTVTAMEFLEGPTLQDILSQEPMDSARLVGVSRQVCKALAAAHDAGLVHRDIKPENIMLVNRDGRADMVKVVDFGLASVVGSTTRRAAVGTPLHMSPEAVLNLPIDGRTDLYSLGSTMYALATGHAPFEAHEKLHAILEAQVSEQPRPPRELVSSIPKALEDVILRCLEKEPRDRYTDARALEAALCEAQIDAKLHTSWDDLPIPDVSDDQRERLLAGMPHGRAPRTSRSRWMILGIVGGAIAASAIFFSMRKPADQRTRVIKREVAAPIQEETELERLAARADDAAAQALFVYPPVDAPETETAYQVVHAVGELEDAEAENRAQELGRQYAATLERLGDEYWERPGGVPFALDFYIQALLFDGERSQARDRAGISPGQLALLRSKALDGSFTSQELIAVEPLQALAEPEPSSRRKKLARVRRNRKRTRPSSLDASLDALNLDDLAGESETGGGDEGETGGTGETGFEGETGFDGDGEAGLDSTGSEKADALAEAAASLFADGKSGPAESTYHRALKVEARHLPSLTGLGDLYYAKARYSQSAKYRSLAASKRPKDAQLRIDLGDAYYKSAKYADAQRAYEVAGTLGHKDAPGRLAKLSAKTGD